MMQNIDLHIHSTYSDGTWKPEEIARRAKAIGLSDFAITDHDTVDGVRECEGCIPAIEFGTYFEGKDVHILGYFINIDNSRLQRELEKQIFSRIERAEKTLKKAEEEYGLYITMDDVKKYAKGKSIGRPHLAQAIQEQYEFGSDVPFDVFYMEHFTKGKRFYVEREKTPTAAAIEAITEADGMPVLAHPAITKIDDQIPALVDKGLIGIEAYYAGHNKEEIKRYVSLAAELELFVTGGSDSHGPSVPIGIMVPTGTVEKMRKHHEENL